ncbi:MAG: hypothetical protein AAF805_09480 [Planctomycetota bacterium]
MLALAASGCAIAPNGAEPSISTDIVGYLQREWPLHTQQQSPRTPACSGAVHAGDWDQPTCHPHAYGRTDDPPPAVPLEPPDRGRFFPVPSRPAFAPQPVAMIGRATGQPPGEPFHAASPMAAR